MISVVLPTYNEKENIVELISRIRKAIPDSEIVVVDDSSPDGTSDAVQEMRLKNLNLIVRKERGLPSAIARGIQESRGDVVGWMDCDLGMPPEKIPELVDALGSADVAVGSRFVDGGKDDRSFSRRLTSSLMNGFARLFLGQVHDYDSGFVFAKKHVFEKVRISPTGYGEYCIQFLYECKKQKFKIAEVPYTFVERLRGESKTTEKPLSMVRHGLMYGTKVLRLRFGMA